MLDTISDDVGKFYTALHPKESVDKVRLTMVGDEGVEFQYTFHGKETQPPRKYLSESHLNSLGVVLFLANARIFNKHAKFLVLDDIVTSFDTSHRRRLLRLLRDEFSDWQIIILTHENIWFDIIKREMGQHGWIFHEVRSDGANGILLENSPATLKEIIEQKKGKEDVTNDLRKLLELVLKNICQALEVRVAFRFNDINEKRMSDELISALRSTLKDKSPDLLDTQIFSDLPPARPRCSCRPLDIDFRDSNRRSPPKCGTCVTHQSYRTESPTTNVRLGAQLLASVCAIHGLVYALVSASLRAPPRGRYDRASCGSSSSPCVPGECRSGDNRTGAAFQRSLSSPCGLRGNPTGVRAGPSLGRHRQAGKPGAARCHDPASP
ncbi:hypothetical protein TG4357_03541 [Thalassovita gelatinovora]|uniref:Recombination protein F n=1 Tax=Thalassovita gelatinovora TaxID=53501 RepID=A0A0P1FK17_THAGE|nr:hypothetical protein TG4357_03541 [Thalassovita gelatinovora]SEQ51030.1 hypothetical protein SAMN04488043_1062 [Thalassovita gelatinovora]